MRHYKSLLLTLALALSLGACRLEEDFRQDTTIRLNKMADEYTQILSSSGKTWLLDYYPDHGQPYGGYPLTLKFEGDKVSALGDLGGSQPVSSGYRLSTSDGVMISFDEYNSEIYTFSLATNDHPQAYGGDIDLIIDGYQDGVFMLRGRKTGNRMTMRPLEQEASQYLEQAKNIRFALWGADLEDVTIEGILVGLSLHYNTRQLIFTFGGKTVRMPYSYTDTGLILYEPLQIGSVTLSELTLDVENNRIYLTPEVSSGITPFPLELALDREKLTFYLEPSYVCPQIYRIYTNRRYQNGYYLYRHAYLGSNYLDMTRISSQHARVTVDYNLGFSAVSGVPDQIRITDYGVGRSHKKYKEATELSRLLIAHSPYSYEQTEQGDFKLTSTTDDSFWFYVGASRDPKHLAKNGSYIVATSRTSSASFYQLYSSAQQEVAQVSAGKYSLNNRLYIGSLKANTLSTGIQFRLSNTQISGNYLRVEYLIEFYPHHTTGQLLFLPQAGGDNWSSSIRKYPRIKTLLDTIIAKAPYIVQEQEGNKFLHTSATDPEFYFMVQARS